MSAWSVQYLWFVQSLLISNFSVLMPKPSCHMKLFVALLENLINWFTVVVCLCLDHFKEMSSNSFTIVEFLFLLVEVTSRTISKMGSSTSFFEAIPTALFT